MSKKLNSWINSNKWFNLEQKLLNKIEELFKEENTKNSQMITKLNDMITKLNDERKPEFKKIISVIWQLYVTHQQMTRQY